MKLVGLVPAVLALCLIAAPPATGEETDPAAEAARILAGLKDPSPEVKLRAALDAAGCPDASLLKALLRLVADPERGVREAAAKALATRAGDADRKKAAAGLNPRLARLSRRLSDEEELLVVIVALGKLAQPSSIKPLLADIKPETATEVAKARLFAVAAVPHKDAVDRLIQYLAKGRRGSHHNGVTSQALQYATGEKFGRDPDKWRAWWREREKTFDFEALARARAEAEAERKEKAARKKERKKERKRGKKGKQGSGEKKKDDEGA